MIPVRDADDGMDVKRWWADTLFKRLFLLMWVALVVSHLCAFFTVRYVHGLDRVTAEARARNHVDASS